MTDFTITDAINSVMLQTREHTDPDNPGAEGTGSETLMQRYGLTNEDVEGPLQRYAIRAAVPMLVRGELDSALLGIFLAGAVFADRRREATKGDPLTPCPACGLGATEVMVIGPDSLRYFKCVNGHRWDAETGALI